MDYKDILDAFFAKYMYLYDIAYFMLAITGVYFIALLLTGNCTLR